MRILIDLEKEVLKELDKAAIDAETKRKVFIEFILSKIVNDKIELKKFVDAFLSERHSV